MVGQIQAAWFDEAAEFTAEQITAAVNRPMRSAYTFDDVRLTIGDEEIPIHNMKLPDLDEPLLGDRYEIPVGWSGTANFTTTSQKVAKPWAESTERAMARVLNLPNMLPAGPQREAELRRSRRRRRNREVAIQGGMIPHGWTPPLPLWRYLRDQLERRIMPSHVTDLIL